MRYVLVLVLSATVFGGGGFLVGYEHGFRDGGPGSREENKKLCDIMAENDALKNELSQLTTSRPGTTP